MHNGAIGRDSKASPAASVGYLSIGQKLDPQKPSLFAPAWVATWSEERQ